MTTQPFLVAPFLYRPLLSNEQTAFRPRKIKYVTDLVGFQVHTIYTLGELPRQAYPHLGWNYSKVCTPCQHYEAVRSGCASATVRRPTRYGYMRREFDSHSWRGVYLCRLVNIWIVNVQKTHIIETW